MDCTKEEKGQEEEGPLDMKADNVDAPDPPNQNANADSMTQDCDVETSVSVHKQTPINADANDKDVTFKSQDDNDKGPLDTKDLVESSSAAKTNNDDASVADTTATQNDDNHVHPLNQPEFVASDEIKAENNDQGEGLNDGLAAHLELCPKSEVKVSKSVADVACEIDTKTSNLSFLNEPPVAEGDESGTEEEQAAFVKEVENFYKDRSLEFKHPKFYKEDLNLLKLWRAVIKLGGYEEVTSCKLWRQVGESFNPPKTCTTVSWTFRIFYEKALLEYEKQRMHDGEHPFRDVSLMEPNRIESQLSQPRNDSAQGDRGETSQANNNQIQRQQANQQQNNPCLIGLKDFLNWGMVLIMVMETKKVKLESGGNQALGSGRARRDAAARAMQGWHSKRFLDSGEVCQPIIKDKNSGSTPKIDRQIKNLGLLKRKRPSTIERAIQVAHMKGTNPQLDSMVIDIGPPADWVKINVQKTSDCFEVYALVPGLLREEVHVQSDPAGRLVISGQPEQLDNPWGVTPFKKVVSLPSRIDPHQTSAVVTLHGQLFVRVPFEQSDL